MAQIEKLIVEDYEIEVHYKKMKNIYLRLKPDGRIMISAPMRTSKKYLTAFATSRIPWIQEKQNKLIHRQKPAQQLAENQILLFGQPVINNLSAKQLHNLLHQKIISYHEKYWHFFASCGCEAIEIKYRIMKSTWGVCRPTVGTITYNKRLVHQPVEFIEYVVLHELCHLLVPNHSREFYDLLRRHMPHFRDYEKMRLIYEQG